MSRWLHLDHCACACLVERLVLFSSSFPFGSTRTDDGPVWHTTPVGPDPNPRSQRVLLDPPEG